MSSHRMGLHQLSMTAGATRNICDRRDFRILATWLTARGLHVPHEERSFLSRQPASRPIRIAPVVFERCACARISFVKVAELPMQAWQWGAGQPKQLRVPPKSWHVKASPLVPTEWHRFRAVVPFDARSFVSSEWFLTLHKAKALDRSAASASSKRRRGERVSSLNDDQSSATTAWLRGSLH
jgi:hypothetical protein